MFVHSIYCYAIFDNEVTTKPVTDFGIQGGSFPSHFDSYLERLFNRNKKMFTKAISLQAPRGIQGIVISRLNNKLSIGLYLVVLYM